MSPEAEDVLVLMRHLADVAALRSDPVLQRQALIDGLGDIFGAALGWFCVADDWLPGRQLRLIHQVFTTTSPPVLLKYLGEFSVTHPASADPYGDHSIRSMDVEQQWTRDKVLPDAAVRARYADCVAVIEKLGIGDGVVCAYRSGKDLGTLVGFSLHRNVGDGKISQEKQELGRVAIREIRRLVERGHLVLRGHSEPSLSPRLNQVLDRLLCGEAPKRIAIMLDLSLWTVREHIQAIYAHFGVSGREELMARFVGNVTPAALPSAP